MTILIVEDNKGVRRLLRHAVSEIASAVHECDDGAGARAAYAVHRPDVVLMDIRMPRMDGLAAARLIRQYDSAALIVMVTDYDDEELRAAAREVGACGFALKHNLPDLVSVIYSVTQERR